MRRVNWTITEGQHRALKQLSQASGLSISELVRRALDYYVNAVDKGKAAIPSPLKVEGNDHEQP